jgi:small subunit ribosomal protein S4
MARYHGPKARINRRLGTLVYESNGAIRAYERRDNPPGMHTRGRRPSNYGLALAEKQKIKHHYGVGEQQLRRYYREAVRRKGNTGEFLLLLCERRLDNVLRRVGLAKSRPQARQGVTHGHFRVNGVKVTSPSFQVKAGDIITIRGGEAIQNLYKGVLANHPPQPIDWVNLDQENLTTTVQGLPGASDISLPVDVNVVVEFLAR